MSERKSRESFGDAQPELQRRKRFATFWKLLFAAVVIALLAFVPLGFRVLKNVYFRIAEKTAPEIVVEELPNGLGNAAAQIVFVVKDEGAGLDEITIKAKQRSFAQDLYLKEFRSKISDQKIALSVNARDLGLREGTAHITVTAFDKSFWNNKSVSNFNLEVDYRAPKLTVLSAQHNAAEGGVELVFYRLNEDGGAARSGVRAGKQYFPGFPASALDPAFLDVPDVHFAFFSAPLRVEGEESRIRVIAEDQTGNLASRSFYYRVQGIPKRKKLLRLSDRFMNERLESVYKHWLEDAATFERKEQVYYPASTVEEKLERLRAVRKGYSEFLNEKAKSLFAKPKAELFWQDVFNHPRGALGRAGFGDNIRETYEDRFADEYTNKELVLGLQAGKKVQAAARGVVIFAGRFGTSGKTVLLDHGFGLVSQYSHLGSFECTEGDRLDAGEAVGRAGRTGLVDQAGYSFSMRLHGEPVRVIEWLDRNWIQGHILDKIAAIKKQLSIQSLTPVEN